MQSKQKGRSPSWDVWREDSWRQQAFASSTALSFSIDRQAAVVSIAVSSLALPVFVAPGVLLALFGVVLDHFLFVVFVLVASDVVVVLLLVAAAVVAVVVVVVVDFALVEPAAVVVVVAFVREKCGIPVIV